MFLFSDEKLSNFTRSESLPFSMGYFKWIDEKTRTNPILEVLVDQISNDQDGPRKYNAASDLLNDILKALDDKKIAWPKEKKVVIYNFRKTHNYKAFDPC